MCFVTKISWLLQFTFQIKNSKTRYILLLVIDGNKSHCGHIIDFDRFMFHKTKDKSKKCFCKSCLQCFSRKKNKKMCLNINCAQSVRLQKGTIEFKNYFKQMPVSFKIYADFECNLKNVESYEGSYSKKYQDYMPCSFAYNLVWVDDKFSKSNRLFLEVKMLFMNLFMKFLKSLDAVKKSWKNTLIWSWVKKKNNSNQVTLGEFVKNTLIMTIKKLEIIVMRLKNLEVQLMGL